MHMHIVLLAYKPGMDFYASINQFTSEGDYILFANYRNDM